MDLQSQQHWVVTAALVTSSVIALVANFLLLLVFCRRRGLRTVSNRFTINLLMTNLLSSVLLIPLLIVDQTSLQEPAVLVEEIIQEAVDESRLVIDEKLEIVGAPNNNTLCYVAQSTVGFVCTASILSVLLIGIDQYFAVIHSLRYHFYIDKVRSTVLIMSAWFVAIFFAILSGLSQNASNLWQFCSRRRTDEDYIQLLNSVYAVVYFLAVVLAPFLAICAIYVCIYSAAHNSSERMRQSTKGPPVKAPSESQLALAQDSPSLQRVRSAPIISNLVDNPANVKRSVSERVGFISHLKHRLSNASVFRYREETRAAKISILVIFMVLVCYIPYGLAVVLNSYIINITTPQSYNYAAVVLLMLSNVVSPFLFAYRNRRIRRELLKLLGLVRAKKTSNAAIPIETPRRRTSEDGKLVEAPTIQQPFLARSAIPEVIITCKVENDKSEKSILKRVCSGKKWPNYKKCNFITVPPSCYQTESARGSFSSASTQVSTDD